jgi:hypothetical protein
VNLRKLTPLADHFAGIGSYHFGADIAVNNISYATDLLLNLPAFFCD